VEKESSVNNLPLYLKTLVTHVFIWIVAFMLFTFFREYGHEVKDGLSTRMSRLELGFFQVILGSIAGILFGTYAYVINRFIGRRFSFGRTVLISSIGYILVILTLIFTGFNMLRTFFDTSMGLADLQKFIAQGNHRVLIVYCFIVGFLIQITHEINRKFGPGNLWRMLKGTYYRPIEEERVLMFLDMRSSTTIAEQLGHIKYSSLVQDCFKDISIVADHAAEIYQYVGDEAVLTWQAKDGFQDNNCVNAFFAFENRLQERSAYYSSKYGIVPEFKAGVNVGIVTTAEVGDLKRDIAFHGDTINTAARIQSKCNELGHDFLVSESVVERLENSPSLRTALVGEVLLRGKNLKVSIHAVHREP
jgi:adenylate cyclase